MVAGQLPLITSLWTKGAKSVDSECKVSGQSVDNQWTVGTGVQCTGSAHLTIGGTISARQWMASVHLCTPLLEPNRDLWAYDPCIKNESGLYGRFAKINRAIQLTFASMLVGLAECMPLGILQVCCAETMDVWMQPSASNIQINVTRTVHPHPDCALAAH